jgi:hypothetical protein|tara:strand:- start:140 stop:268 length:129 start_codon:yes stop_codon:yes gene_type:complete
MWPAEREMSLNQQATFTYFAGTHLLLDDQAGQTASQPLAIKL